MINGNTFYDHQHLTIESKIELMKFAQSICFECIVDKLECSVSFARQRVEMPFDEILSLFNNKSHFVIIKRWDYLKNHYYLEIGFSSNFTPKIEYFLWLMVDESFLPNIIEKYSLTVLL